MYQQKPDFYSYLEEKRLELGNFRQCVLLGLVHHCRRLLGILVRKSRYLSLPYIRIKAKRNTQCKTFPNESTFSHSLATHARMLRYKFISHLLHPKEPHALFCSQSECHQPKYPYTNCPIPNAHALAHMPILIRYTPHHSPS